ISSAFPVSGQRIKSDPGGGVENAQFPNQNRIAGNGQTVAAAIFSADQTKHSEHVVRPAAAPVFVNFDIAFIILLKFLRQRLLRVPMQGGQLIGSQSAEPKQRTDLGGIAADRYDPGFTFTE